MKIEMCEQLACAWLRYVKDCQVVQTNWTPSPVEAMYAGHSKIDDFVNLCQEALGEDYERTFKKSAPSQIFSQCEIDVMGVRLEGNNVEKVYLVDTAFHVGGLGYDNNEARVTKKILRAALVAAVVFPDSPLHIIFATPKARAKDVSDLNNVGDTLRSLFRERSMDVEVSIFMNESFASEMFSPLVQKLSGVADTSMLFLRALQLCHLMNYLKEPSEAGAVGAGATAGAEGAAPNVTGRAPRGSNKDLVRSIIDTLRGEDGQLKSPVRLSDLTSVEYAKRHFGLSGFPFMAAADEISLKDNRRYYPELVRINGGDYRVCSQWIPERIAKLQAWYDRIRPSLTEGAGGEKLA